MFVKYMLGRRLDPKCFRTPSTWSIATVHYHAGTGIFGSKVGTLPYMTLYPSVLRKQSRRPTTPPTRNHALSRCREQTSPGIPGLRQIASGTASMGSLVLECSAHAKRSSHSSARTEPGLQGCGRSEPPGSAQSVHMIGSYLQVRRAENRYSYDERLEVPPLQL